MVASARFIVTGIRQIDKKLKTLPLRVQKKVVRQALRAGLKLVAAGVKAEAPVDTRTMRRAVKVRAVKRKKRGTIELECRIQADENTKKTSARTGKTVFYPAIVEYGTSKVPPNPFMKRAFAATGKAARAVVLRMLKTGIDREIEAKS